MKQEVIIQPITIHDLETLQQLSRQTFFETFAHQNTEANMTHYLETAFSLEKLSEELLEPDAAFFFSLWNDEPVGYLKIILNKHPDGHRDPRYMEIERIYVRSTFHGKGVAGILFEKALSIARNNLIGYVWLGVWEHNPRAIAFYSKYGFSAFGKHDFFLGEDRQTDILMGVSLN
jgi:ribosomal protein S18 acetylase RimI-like enzyme